MSILKQNKEVESLLYRGAINTWNTRFLSYIINPSWSTLYSPRGLRQNICILMVIKQIAIINEVSIPYSWNLAPFIIRYWSFRILKKKIKILNNNLVTWPKTRNNKAKKTKFSKHFWRYLLTNSVNFVSMGNWNFKNKFGHAMFFG